MRDGLTVMAGSAAWRLCWAMGDKVGSAFVVKRRCRLARPSAAVAARLRFRKGDRGEGKVVADVG